ncbi:MAG: DUF2478 domain-containing protein [Paracoccus sp. (in: a-proteobacteria)]|uniref:DUF2478 domain-containing protein n=1 Tax=Paracoccus sp. TaxID=267 RepID=UPI0026DF3B2B|nr:DUF2478 domain-containing protein [Paracoccus sp. (in: a-proteobacteria)]MDO5632004.1 DUF2478 domain-containing protein [Paracoccus sp. (in: a-proteobacteria)]
MTMQLGFFCDAPGDPYDRLADLADTLTRDGARLAGAVQRNSGGSADCACDVDLILLGDAGAPVRISQLLGAGSVGCRLDAGALETAVARIATRIEGADLVILSKFGKQEAAGRGFAALIGQALQAGRPVILYVAPDYRAEFDAFAGGLAQELPADAIAAWCRDSMAASVA